ncbi:S9 family peptidase [Aliidiomarina sedimenti]|uniref:S9 family peptidase n=1 Tax=Aliidiomarina sedimenti TaxID=1933879 RepID=A0ABY0C2E8_9GAMM|nr:prolyl oligopeptidase family serine peptidase [Aliidiomarina sedimenti]RUO31976.1 S9 family peptidase [Aliidiomarina sedimenti]
MNYKIQGSTLSCCVLLAASSSVSLASQTDSGYQQPPQEVIDIVDAAPAPNASVAPGGEYMLIQHLPALPSLTDLATPEYRLAGRRINPANNSISQARYAERLEILTIDSGERVEITGLPDDARVLDSSWSPNAEHLALLNMADEQVELYHVDASSGEASRWSDVQVNAVWGANVHWNRSSDAVYTMAVTPERGDEPAASPVPSGPVITESRGRTAPARTYQDLLANSHDEALFDHYFSSRIARISLDDDVKYLGDEAIYNDLALSPDSNYLLVTELQRPYSYSVPHFRFARRSDVWNLDGERIYQVVDQALADNLPISFDAVVPERRSISWRNDAPATLVWAQALDSGNPNEETDYRDAVYQLSAPFEDDPEQLIQLRNRFAGIHAGDDENAIISERWWASREERVWHLSPNHPENPKMLWERSWQDRYSDPGEPVMRRNEFGRSVLRIEDGHLLMIGDGASDQGDRPFIDRFSLQDSSSERLWRSEAPYYEMPRALLDAASMTFLTQREAVDQPADFYKRSLTNDSLVALTETEHPMPHTLGISRELIHYEREDGLAMSATLFLPDGYDAERDGPLPTIIWAYPREYRSNADAAQVSGSPYEFNRISYWRPQFLATQGYAVMDNATMPIVGEGDALPNDTFIDQLIMNSEAAIQAGVERGVTDPERVALGGHSYGAFMTANVLAHSDLFQAGIARSGAYNRTLTPFGFQREERTVWDDPALYQTMSPFFSAHQIKTPLLLIHGQNDNNSGTFPMQSERLFQAVKGLGGTTRLVMLPLESHGYRARESVLHMLWETIEWLDEFVKQAED